MRHPAKLSNILDLTNRNIGNTVETLQCFMKETGKYTHIKPVDISDIRAAFTIMYFRGLYSLQNHSIDIVFSIKEGLPPFRATMSKRQCKFIISHLCFDNLEH